MDPGVMAELEREFELAQMQIGSQGSTTVITQHYTKGELSHFTIRSVGGPHSSPPAPAHNQHRRMKKIDFVHKWKGAWCSQFGCGSVFALAHNYNYESGYACVRGACDWRPRPCQYDMFPRD